MVGHIDALVVFIYVYVTGIMELPITALHSSTTIYYAHSVMATTSSTITDDVLTTGQSISAGSSICRSNLPLWLSISINMWSSRHARSKVRLWVTERPCGLFGTSASLVKTSVSVGKARLCTHLWRWSDMKRDRDCSHEAKSFQQCLSG